MEHTALFAGNLWIWVIFIGFTLISWLISNQLKSRFTKYSKIPTANGMTGRDVAEKMLRDNGITGVKIGSVEGQLTDHYNPVNKTINLSKEVYFGNSIAAAAVAAHECGHAVQHAKAYSMLKMRSALVPVVSFASHWVQWILLAGILMVNTFPQLLLMGVSGSYATMITSPAAPSFSTPSSGSKYLPAIFALFSKSICGTSDHAALGSQR